jgi:hypothetical protein
VKFYCTIPERNCDSRSLLHNEYRVLSGVKRPGRSVDDPPHLGNKDGERVELHIFPYYNFMDCSRVTQNFTSQYDYNAFTYTGNI